MWTYSTVHGKVNSPVRDGIPVPRDSRPAGRKSRHLRRKSHPAECSEAETIFISFFRDFWRFEMDFPLFGYLETFLPFGTYEFSQNLRGFLE
jgi:hypothetical protein